MGIGTSLSGLASSVTNMGGIGVSATVDIGFLRVHPDNNFKNWYIDAIEYEIRKSRKLSKGILVVNIVYVIPKQPSFALLSHCWKPISAT